MLSDDALFYNALYSMCFSVQNAVEVTGTFKQMKGRLVEQGFDLGQIQDPLYILDDKEKSYVPLTPDIYSSIISGNVKL